MVKSKHVKDYLVLSSIRNISRMEEGRHCPSARNDYVSLNRRRMLSMVKSYKRQGLVYSSWLRDGFPDHSTYVHVHTRCYSRLRTTVGSMIFTSIWPSRIGSLRSTFAWRSRMEVVGCYLLRVQCTLLVL